MHGDTCGIACDTRVVATVAATHAAQRQYARVCGERCDVNVARQGRPVFQPGQVEGQVATVDGASDLHASTLGQL